MAREDVNIKVSASIAEAVRMWRAMEAGPQGMARELDALGRRGKSAGDTMAGGFDKAIGKWAKLGTQIQAAKMFLSAYMAANREAMQLQNEASMSLDTLARQFQVQGGLSGEMMRKAVAQVTAIANRRGVSLTDAMGMGKQMLSSGFTYDEVIGGGALEAGLTTANAMSATGKGFNATEFTAAIAQYFNATEQDKTAANVLRLGQQMYNLYQRTDVQPEDLKELAPEAKKIGALTGMTDAEMLGVFSQFRDVTSAANASTAMRAGYVNLATAGGDQARTKALGELGLTPDDVNFRGESFLEVQERIAKALEGAGDDRGAYAKKLFGDEGMLWDVVMANERGIAQTRERVGWTGDRDKFNEAARTTEEGLLADRNRAETEVTEAFADLSVVDSDTARKRFMAGLKREGAWMPTRMIAMQGFDASIDAGASVEQALQFSTPGAAPWRAFGNNAERDAFIKEVTTRTTAEPFELPPESAGAGQQLDVRVHLLDQNNQRMPHRAEVRNVGKNSAAKQGR